MSSTVRQSSSLIRTSRPSRVSPALLTRMSTSPAASTSALADSGSETSASTARPPISPATDSASSPPVRYATTTAAPACPSSRRSRARSPASRP